MASALAIRHTREDDTARKNAENNAQVKRYWPGRAPDWVDENDAVPLDEEAEEEDEQEETEEAPAATRVAAPVIVKKVRGSS